MMKFRVYATAALLAVTLFGRANAADGSLAGADRAQNLVGRWTCQTVSQSSTVMTFTQSAAGTLDMTNVVTAADGRSGEFDEHYRYDAAANRWSWTATVAGTGNFAERGSAPEWTGNDWIFDGTMTTRSTPDADSIASARVATQPVRMIYTYVDADAFARQFQEQQSGGSWKTRSASNCRRQS